MALLSLTFNHNNVSLRADPLDFRSLLQIIAVGVVGGAALVRARVLKGKAGEAKGACGVFNICGIDFYTVAMSPVKQLGEGLIGLFAFNKPPLNLRYGVPYHLAVQLGAVIDQSQLRERRSDETRWLAADPASG